MPNYVFAPSSSHTGHVPFTVTDIGISVQVVLFLATKVNASGPTDSSVIAVASTVLATTTGASQTVNCPLVMPATLPSGIIYACVDVIYQGQVIISLVDSANTIQGAFGAAGGAITWD